MVKLVLLPGMDGTGELFADFVAALPATFDALVVRYPTNFLPYDELEKLVQAVCPKCEPFVLVAESFSTPLALQYAANNPTNLRGVVLCAGFATNPVRGLPRLLASLLAPLLFRVRLTSRATNFWLVGKGASPSLVAAVRNAILTVRPDVLSARLRAVLSCDVRKAASQIGMPILYLRPKQDRLVGIASLEELRQINPQMDVVEIDGPHLILQGKPSQTAEIIARFVQAISTSRAI